MRSVHGPSAGLQKPHKLPVSFSMCIYISEKHTGRLPDNSSDFENKFVCGEIMSYEDLHELGSESAVKAAGKLRQQGKPYESKCFTMLRRLYGLNYRYSGRR